MSEVEEIAAGLSEEQRAVLIAWTGDEMPRHYPRPMAEETRVMKALAERGLFRFTVVHDDELGDCRSVGSTDLGRAVAAHLRKEKG